MENGLLPIYSFRVFVFVLFCFWFWFHISWEMFVKIPHSIIGHLHSLLFSSDNLWWPYLSRASTVFNLDKSAFLIPCYSIITTFIRRRKKKEKEWNLKRLKYCGVSFCGYCAIYILCHLNHRMINKPTNISSNLERNSLTFRKRK